jgi:hypothetical protein
VCYCGPLGVLGFAGLGLEPGASTAPASVFLIFCILKCFGHFWCEEGTCWLSRDHLSRGFLFFVWWDWGLNSGLPARATPAVHFALVILEMGVSRTVCPYWP